MVALDKTGIETLQIVSSLVILSNVAWKVGQNKEERMCKT
jgi:hypothetical protein